MFEPNKLTILTYHGVSPEGKFIRPKTFSRHIDFIKRRYHVLPLDNAVEKLYRGALPRNALAITFDDGYKNLYDFAFPVLREFNLPATMFLPTDFVFNKMPIWTDLVDDSDLKDEMKKLPDHTL